MKKCIMIGLCFIVLLLIVSTVSASVEPGVTSNVCRNPRTDGFINFEEGHDGQVIASSIPGVVFTMTGGLDWRYGNTDEHTYNIPPYVINGKVFGWLGETGSAGQITFTESPATYVSALVSTYSGVMIDAYDADDNLIATSGTASNNVNPYTGTMTRLTVEAPAGKEIAYVIVHDTGNYWLIDDICTDATGLPPYPSPEFPTVLLPATFIVGFLGIVLIIQRINK